MTCRMPRKPLNLLAVAGAVAVLMVAVPAVTSSGTSGDVHPSGTEPSVGLETVDAIDDAASVAPASSVSPQAVPAPVRPAAPSAGVRTYAISVPSLRGFPPDASPGSEFELWVAWEPPLTERPKIQLLVKRIVLKELIPPVTPEGPTVAVFALAVEALPDVLYADRYGRMSVAEVLG